MRWRDTGALKEGDIRGVRRFAWFPTTLTDGWTVWFETYQATERYEMLAGEPRPDWYVLYTEALYDYP